MSYIVAINGIYQHKVPNGNIEWDSTHFCPASALTPEEVTQFNVFPLTLVGQPAFDLITKTVAEGDPALVNGEWVQQWLVSDLPPEVVAVNQARVEATRQMNLWQAAHDLEYASISGSAIGLITMGVLGGKPKCLAVQAWIKSIWTEYYVRKAGTSTDTDFAAVAGSCPHSVPELMVELGV